MLFAFSPDVFSAPWFNSSKKHFHGVGARNEPMPFMFCCGLGFRFFLFASEYDQHVFDRLTVDGVYVPECLQRPFLQQGVKTINFHLLGHHGLHFDHRMEQVLKELKLFALAIKCHGVLVAGLIVIDCCLFWKLARASANLFNGSWSDSGTSGSGAG